MIAFAVVAGLMLIGVLVGRIIRDRLDARRRRQREAIARAFLQISLGGEARLLAPYASRELLVAEDAQDMADIVRGPELAKIKAALDECEIAPRLITRLHKGRKRQKMVAAETLALFPGAPTLSALRAALEDRSAEVRLAALFSLLELGSPPPIADVLRVMGSGDWSHSLLVTELLRRMGQERQDELAAEIAREDRPAAVQVMLLEAVAGAGEFEVMPAVAGHADDEDASVRAAALRALGRLAHPQAAPEIEHALEDRSAAVRRDAVVAAHKAGLHELAPALGRRLTDSAWAVRHVAARALTDLGDPGRSELTLALAGADEPRRREILLAMKSEPLW